MTTPRAVFVFDGDCSMCNGFVAFLVRHHRDGRVLIAGSAGEAGRRAFVAAGLDPQSAQSTALLWDGRTGRTQSAAIAHTLGLLPWPWRLGRALAWAPRPLRDGIYRFVAARRRRVTADDPACGIPPAHLVERWRSMLATPDDVARLNA